ncbi:MAG: ComEC/Rec2 family competence protein [bacterium]|nr:ComEC/Rec2 family competence protein [bacterium]
MSLHTHAFWISVLFLIGVLSASITPHFIFIIISVFIVGLYCVAIKKYRMALLMTVIIGGAGYTFSFNAIKTAETKIPFETNTFFEGVVVNIDQYTSRQNINLKLKAPYYGVVRISTQRYPSFAYGDLLEVQGTIQKPDPEITGRLLKDGIRGIVQNPKITVSETNQGNPIKALLFSFKNNMVHIFERTLPSESAALVSGMTLGERGNFSKELTEQMSLSGTTHIVALSGYNISVVAWVIASFIGVYLSRRLTFGITIVCIIGFVVMAGAEASVVRAAVMGGIVLLGRYLERSHSMRNAIAISALVMVLYNPHILVFDIGFQLSFAALIGMIYVRPVLAYFLKITESGLFSWKDNLVTTLAAQLAVAPLLLGSFGIFSISSFIANILILESVPLTMGLGFVMGFVGFISEFCARIIGFLVTILTSYQLFIIEIFSKINIPIIVDSFDIFASAIYYSAFGGLLYWYYHYAKKK